MKKLALFIVISIFTLSCSDGKKQSVEDLITTNNLQEIRAKKTELEGQQQAISALKEYWHNGDLSVADNTTY